MSRGIACEIAGDGQKAIDIIQRKGDAFDFIFMDHFMPIMVRNNQFHWIWSRLFFNDVFQSSPLLLISPLSLSLIYASCNTPPIQLIILILSYLILSSLFYFSYSQTGIDATRGIRAAGFERLIFGLTGDALDEDVKIFLDAGADCVLGKVQQQVIFSTHATLQNTSLSSWLKELMSWDSSTAS